MANKIVTFENLERYHNEISQIIDSKQDAISDLNEYAKKSDIPQIDGLASEAYVNTKFDEVFQNVSNGKYLIASALTDKGVYASDDDTFQELSDKINQIIVAAPGSNLVGYVDDENDIYISLSGIANGTYTLKFENANGVLSGFDTIGEVVIDDSSDSFKALLDCNVAPQQASKIGLYDSNGNSVGTIPLYNYKLLSTFYLLLGMV